jgi:hypothetical protein
MGRSAHPCLKHPSPHLRTCACLSDNACDLLVWALVAGYYDKLTSNINTVPNGGPTLPPTSALNASMTAWTVSCQKTWAHVYMEHTSSYELHA